MRERVRKGEGRKEEKSETEIESDCVRKREIDTKRKIDREREKI